MSHHHHQIRDLPDRRKKLIKRYNQRISFSLSKDEKVHKNAPIQLPEVPKVGIVGAGISGLSLAYLLQQGFPGKKFDITIFESQDRIGGRVHTVYFKDEDGNQSNDQFAELGAMRLPFQTGDLVFERITTAVNNLNLDLIDWNSPGSPSYIDYQLRQTDDPFTFKELIPHLPIPPIYANQTPTELNGKIILIDRKYFDEAKDVEEGLDHLLKERPNADQWSYRDALRFHIRHTYTETYGKLDPYHLNAIDNIIDQIELVESATGLLNLSWIEALIDSYTFNHTLKTVRGGLSKITTGIQKLLLNVKIHLNSRVFKVDKYEGGGVNIWVKNLSAQTEESHEFDLFFVTSPFSALRDWSWSSSISKLRRNFFRQLNYDNSSKIYVLWPEKVVNWASKVIKDVNKGATLITDLMIRKLVYPANDESDRVTLVSYTWAQDALAWGALNDEETLQLVVRQVNEIHGTSFNPADCQILKKTWTADPNYFGAFALYSPTQFMSLPLLQEPEHGYDGRLFFAGEHLSYNHAWLAGAVDSSYRALRKLAKRQDWTFDTKDTIFEKTPEI